MTGDTTTTPIHRLGAYELRSQIGEGGMGVVYRAFDAEGKPVAVKVLRPHIAGDQEGRDRFAREVRAMRRVRGPYVAEVLDANVTAETPYVVTRYVDGPPLYQVIAEGGPLTERGLVRLAGGLAEALEAIHAAGVVHRDLKPGNVLMLRGQPVVIDFGIAQVADEARLTSTGMLVGTPGYLAPEVLEGRLATWASDIHSWAATMAYAATGRPPFGRGPFEAVAFRVVSGRADLAGVPDRLLPLLRMAMSRNPRERPRPGELVDLVGTPKGARILAAARPRPPVSPAVGSVVPLPGSTRAFTAPAPAPRPASAGGSPEVAPAAAAGAAGAGALVAAAGKEWRPTVRSLLQRLLGEPPDDAPGHPTPGDGQYAPVSRHQPGSGGGQQGHGSRGGGPGPESGRYGPASLHQPGPGGGRQGHGPRGQPGSAGGRQGYGPGGQPGSGSGQYGPASRQQAGSGGGQQGYGPGGQPGSGSGQYGPASRQQAGSGGGQQGYGPGGQPGPGSGQYGPASRQQAGLGGGQYAPAPRPGAPMQQGGPQQAPVGRPQGAPQPQQRAVAWSPHLVRPRPLLSVLLLLVVAAAGANAPFVTLGFLALAFVLVRTVDRQGQFLRLRRDRRGRTASDLVVTVSALPWHAARSALFTLLTVPLAAIVGLTVTVLVALFAPPDLPVTNTHVLGALFVGLTAVFAWWGIEGEGVRSGTRRILGLVSQSRPVVSVAILVLSTVAFGVALNASSGPVEWWPFDDDPRSLVGGIVSWLRAHRFFL